jgi:hypothetical protein
VAPPGAKARNMPLEMSYMTTPWLTPAVMRFSLASCPLLAHNAAQDDCVPQKRQR